MRNLSVKYLVMGLAVLGSIHSSLALPPPVTPPPIPGLFLYDTATGLSEFAPSSGGIASYNGTVGDYTVAISTGQTVVGGANPVLDLSVSTAQTSTSGDSLMIYYSDGSFGPTSGLYALSSFAFSGSVSSYAYLGAAPFDFSNPLGGSPDGNGVVTYNAIGPITANNYYLTMEDDVSGNVVSEDSTLQAGAVIPVPEPDNLLPFGLVLLSLGFATRRFLKQRAAGRN